MAYRTVRNACEGYGPRKGLEGPFDFMGRVLYYDNIEGLYYDPRTDFYVEQAEMNQIHDQLMSLMNQKMVA